MTKLELTTQLMNLAVAGYFNGEKFSKERLNTYIGKMCRNNGDKLYMEIALPDGRWLFKQYGENSPELQLRGMNHHLFNKKK